MLIYGSYRKLFLIGGGHDVYKENQKEMKKMVIDFIQTRIPKKVNPHTSFIKSLTLKSNFPKE